MREPPWFWRSHSLAARGIRALLAPAAFAYEAGHKIRWALTEPAHASIPVICVGNATLGGTGKTPFAMLLAELLREEGLAPAFLTRGYGGAMSGPLIVTPDHHGAYDVGDEAMLLAQKEMTIVSRDRPAGAGLAASQGAQVLIMDDGFQNPTLHKNFSILLTDNETKDARALFPAGPLRERPEDAKARAQLVIAMGSGHSDADFNAWLEPASPEPAPSELGRVMAFAGIGKPEKFFNTLKESGYDIVQQIGFPDHHNYTTAELKFLAREAKREKAQLICTEKDAVKLPADFLDATLVLKAAMRVNDRDGLKRRLMTVINAAATSETGYA